MSVSLNSWEEKEKGNDAFKRGAYALAIQHYTAAISNDIDPGDPLYYTNRAQAYLKVEDYAAAEADCTSAITINPTLSKAFWRRATARKDRTPPKLQGAIDDYREWLRLATAENKADAASKKVMTDHVAEIEAILRGEPRTPATLAAKSRPASASASATPANGSSAPARNGGRTLLGREEPALRAHLDKIEASYSELQRLWEKHGDAIITLWKELAIPDLREAKIKPVFDPIKPKKAYPEFKPSSLIDGDNLLDFLSSRASHSPPHFAFHLDLGRAQLVRAQAVTSRPAALRPGAYMLLSDDSYGRIVDVNTPAEVEARQKAIEKGDACEKEDGVAMLLRQVECYAAALKAAKVLVEDEGEMDEELVKEYAEGYKNKAYSGRDEYSIDRVEAIVKSSRAYAEDHLDFLREDAEYVSEHIMDRIPSAVPITATDMIDLLGKEEAMEMFLNGFARQTLWKEVLNVIEILKGMQSEPGSGKTLPAVYQRKIGLLAKLVEAFINLTFKELSASVEKSFEKEFRLMAHDEEGGDSFYAFLDMMAEIQGMPSRDRAPRRRARADPLASLFKALIKLDPQQMPKQTWEIVACLNELKELFDRQPGQKTRLSRRVVEGLGEYTEAIELREMLLDSHRPRFSRDWSDAFLNQLGPLWQQLERCWTKAVSGPMIGKVIRQKTAASLTAVWTKFEAEVVRQLKDKPEALFDKLLSNKVDHHAARFVFARPGQGATNARAPRAQVDDSEDSDVPPALVEGSDDSSGPPSPYISGDEDDSDVPPALYASSSDSEDPDMPDLESEEESSEDEAPRRPAPRRPVAPPRRRRVRVEVRPPPRPAMPEPTPGPSHSSRAPRVPAPAVDMSGIRPDHEFGAVGGVRPPSPEERRPRERKVKKKTRKEQDGARANGEGSTSASATDETTDDSSTDAEGGLPEGVIFKVTERVYATFEQYIGIGPHISRTDVPWTDFLHAMDFIGFSPCKTTGSSWKFYPRGVLRNNDSISVHEPHPDSDQRVHQVSWVGKRLKRQYGLNMDMFEISTERQNVARSTL